jgi:hypothetical protein
MTGDLDQLIELMAAARDFAECTGLFMDWVQDTTGCEAAMLRLREEDSGEGFWIPALVQRGFDRAFLRDEILVGGGECLCGKVCSGCANQALPLFNEHGSFSCDHAETLLSGDALSTVKEIRGRCMMEGYRSLVIVPLTSGETPLGCLHLADRRPGVFAAQLPLIEEACRRAGPLLQRYPPSEREPLLIEALETVLTPPDLPQLPGVELGVSFTSATDAARLGGDFYDVIPLPEGDVVLVVGDFSGKGIGAAGMAARARHEIARRVDAVTPLDRVLLQADRALQSVLGRSRFVTAAACRVRPEGQCEIALAGHPRPFVLAPGGESREVYAPPNAPLGLALRPVYETGMLEVDRDEILLLYTDGIIEARCGGRMFDVEGVRAFWTATGASEVQALTEGLCEASMRFGDTAGSDDRLALALRRRVG